MAEIKDKNYSFAHFSKAVPSNGDHFINCNLTQPQPNTAIFSSITGLRFTRCNLCNCNVPGDAVLENSPNRHINFCSHLKPKMAEYTSGCVEACSHVVDFDEVIIDGTSLGKVYHYKHSEGI